MLKKSQIFTIVACGTAALLLTGVLAAGLAGDGFPLGEEPVKKPKTHENRVDIDLTEDAVESLDIYWVDGQVNILSSPDGNIHVVERSDSPLEEEEKMDVKISDGTLKVVWDGQWFNKFTKWIRFGWLQSGGKELTVELPSSVAENLSVFRVATTSGDVTVSQACRMEEGEVTTTSGEVRLQNVAAEKALRASSVSGDIGFEGVSCQELSMNTTSGSLWASGAQIEKAEVNTTSGDSRIQGAVQRVHGGTVSGEILLELSQCPATADLDSVSGELSLRLPSDSGFEAVYSSVSGDFSCEFPGTGEGGKSGKFVCGSGQGKFRFNTTSGDMSIERGNR